jgi:cyclophilin family peptidyl-prolyl cis-trans isomerase
MHTRFLSTFCAVLLLLIWTSVRGGTLVQFLTPLGRVDVELFDEEKPETVGNFLRYVQSGAYEDGFIHRWEPGFVIQGGGYVVTNRAESNAWWAPIQPRPEITNEFSIGKTYSNTYGTIAMARRPGETNSASSQWFFNLRDNASLDTVDGGFTVFGRVVGGTNVLDRFNNLSLTNGIYWAALSPTLTVVPVLTTNATVQDFVFVQILPVSLEIQTNTLGVREISWNSVSNRLQHLEYTTSLAGEWNSLMSTNGTGERVRFTEGTPRTQTRFYRIRVEYP